MCMSECMNKYHIANQKVCVVVLFKLFVYKHICTNTYAYTYMHMYIKKSLTFLLKDIVLITHER